MRRSSAPRGSVSFDRLALGRRIYSVGRFVAEIEAAAAGAGKLRPGYVLAGDEIFLLDRCRAAVIKAFVPADLRDFCLSDLDLTHTSIFEVLDRAQTPSLMAPVSSDLHPQCAPALHARRQEGGIRRARSLFQSPNPQALLLFIADFLRIPSDARRMELDDKNRFERLTETLGEHCGMVELARVERGRRHALGRQPRRRRPACAWSPTPRASWWTRSAPT